MPPRFPDTPSHNRWRRQLLPLQWLTHRKQRKRPFDGDTSSHTHRRRCGLPDHGRHAADRRRRRRSACCSSRATTASSRVWAPSPRSPSAFASPAAARAVALRGLHRGTAGAAQTDPSGKLRVEVERAPRRRPRRRTHPQRSSASTAPWSRSSSSCAATTGGSPPSCARSPSPARWPTPPATRPDITYERQGRAAARPLDVTERLELALALQRERLAELQVRARIRDDVQSGAEKQQREYFLRKQMESIRKELGEDDALGRRRVPQEDRGRRHARRRPRAGRARAGPAGADGRAVRREPR